MFKIAVIHKTDIKKSKVFSKRIVITIQEQTTKNLRIIFYLPIQLCSGRFLPTLTDVNANRRVIFIVFLNPCGQMSNCLSNIRNSYVIMLKFDWWKDLIFCSKPPNGFL